MPFAHQDLAESQKLDFDDDTAELQKLVDAKYKKIAEKKNRDRLKAEKKKEQERKRRKEEAQRAYEEAKNTPSGGGYGFPGGFPGSRWALQRPTSFNLAGIDPSMLSGIMSDPELMQAFQDPRMAQVMQDIMANPGNIAKYQSDPEVMGLINKVMGAFSKGLPLSMQGDEAVSDACYGGLFKSIRLGTQHRTRSAAFVGHVIFCSAATCWRRCKATENRQVRSSFNKYPSCNCSPHGFISFHCNLHWHFCPG
ncbi:unnamed protein product [Effrenium voratum]|nr:unnamed protein product [Effrenium voratum]